jgi:hypothetical protein
MLGIDILSAIAAVYFSGAVLSASYHMLRISELKLLNDSTRVKDTKNDCVSMAKRHVHDLKHCWAWPVKLLDLGSLSWARGLDKK